MVWAQYDRLCGLVAMDPEVPGSIPGPTRFFWEVVGLERGQLSLVMIIEELLERTAAAPV
jgi:hypothetical protein